MALSLIWVSSKLINYFSCLLIFLLRCSLRGGFFKRRKSQILFTPVLLCQNDIAVKSSVKIFFIKLLVFVVVCGFFFVESSFIVFFNPISSNFR